MKETGSANWSVRRNFVCVVDASEKMTRVLTYPTYVSDGSFPVLCSNSLSFNIVRKEVNQYSE